MPPSTRPGASPGPAPTRARSWPPCRAPFSAAAATIPPTSTSSAPAPTRCSAATRPAGASSTPTTSSPWNSPAPTATTTPASCARSPSARWIRALKRDAQGRGRRAACRRGARSSRAARSARCSTPMRRASMRRGYRAHRLNACGYSLGTTFAPNWMDWPMLYHGNPVEAAPGMVFFLHMIVFDAEHGLAMTLGRTSEVTSTGARVLSRAQPRFRALLRRHAAPHPVLRHVPRRARRRLRGALMRRVLAGALDARPCGLPAVAASARRRHARAARPHPHAPGHRERCRVAGGGCRAGRPRQACRGDGRGAAGSRYPRLHPGGRTQQPEPARHGTGTRRRQGRHRRLASRRPRRPRRGTGHQHRAGGTGGGQPRRPQRPEDARHCVGARDRQAAAG